MGCYMINHIFQFSLNCCFRDIWIWLKMLWLYVLFVNTMLTKKWVSGNYIAESWLHFQKLMYEWYLLLYWRVHKMWKVEQEGGWKGYKFS